MYWHVVIIILMLSFVIGEHGFYPWSYQWDEFYYLLVSTRYTKETSLISGSNTWSCRSDGLGHATTYVFYDMEFT